MEAPTRAGYQSHHGEGMPETTSTQTTLRGVSDGAITVHRYGASSEGRKEGSKHELIRILKRYVAAYDPLNGSALQPQPRILP